MIKVGCFSPGEGSGGWVEPGGGSKGFIKETLIKGM